MTDQQILKEIMKKKDMANDGFKKAINSILPTDESRNILTYLDLLIKQAEEKSASLLEKSMENEFS